MSFYADISTNNTFALYWNYLSIPIMEFALGWIRFWSAEIILSHRYEGKLVRKMTLNVIYFIFIRTNHILYRKIFSKIFWLYMYFDDTALPQILNWIRKPPFQLLVHLDHPIETSSNSWNLFLQPIPTALSSTSVKNTSKSANTNHLLPVLYQVGYLQTMLLSHHWPIFYEIGRPPTIIFYAFFCYKLPSCHSKFGKHNFLYVVFFIPFRINDRNRSRLLRSFFKLMLQSRSLIGQNPLSLVDWRRVSFGKHHFENMPFWINSGINNVCCHTTFVFFENFSFWNLYFFAFFQRTINEFVIGKIF